MVPIPSRSLLTLLIIALGACSRARPTSPAEAAQAVLRITDRHGTLQAPLCEDFFKTLLGRLVGQRGRDLHVVVLNTTELLALSPGSNSILVSRGLLGLFENEAELSFMIAHEAGHHILNHHDHGLSIDGDSSTRRDLESEADAFAVAAMARAGYDSSYAVSALSSVYNRLKDEGQKSDQYPSLHERIINVATLALGYGNLGRGTADRRSFHQCLSTLS